MMNHVSKLDTLVAFDKSTLPPVVSAENEIQGTILVYIHEDSDGIQVTHFSIGGIQPEDDATSAFDHLKDYGVKNPPKLWKQYGNGVAIEFEEATKVYFAINVDGWQFASQKGDAITLKRGVSNYYYAYRRASEPKYKNHVFSMINNYTFKDAEHEFNLHCQVKISNELVDVTVDPKFKNRG